MVIGLLLVFPPASTKVDPKEASAWPISRRASGLSYVLEDGN
jgi:hypothetical protein